MLADLSGALHGVEDFFSTMPSVCGIVLVVGIATWIIRRTKRAVPNVSKDGPVDFAAFDERPLTEVERTFDELVTRGTLRVEPATAEDRAKARIPEHAGPAFRALAARYRMIELAEVGVSITLHDGSEVDDAIGGWRFRAEPAEIDVRLAPPTGAVENASGDVVLDATWSPRSSHQVARHSSLVHFFVRSAIGDRA